MHHRAHRSRADRDHWIKPGTNKANDAPQHRARSHRRDHALKLDIVQKAPAKERPEDSTEGRADACCRRERDVVVRESVTKREQQREHAEDASADERSEQRPAEDEGNIGCSSANPTGHTSVTMLARARISCAKVGTKNAVLNAAQQCVRGPPRSPHPSPSARRDLPAAVGARGASTTAFLRSRLGA